MKYLNITVPEQRKSRHAAFIPLVLFGLAVVGASLYIRMNMRPPRDPVFLTTRHEIPGFRFVPVALGSRSASILGTTNFFNGHFFDSRLRRVSVFSANWQPGDGNVISLSHTPENCWTGNEGFQTLRLGESNQVFLFIRGRRISFQCRVLKHPAQQYPEIALWSAGIDGRWDILSSEPAPNLIDQQVTTIVFIHGLTRIIKERLSVFLKLTQDPLSPSASKQFVRLSTPLTTDWQTTISELERFAGQWLDLY
jgi:hypothetical protein